MSSGGKPKAKAFRFSIDLSERDYSTLESLCAKHDLTKAEVLRRAMRLYGELDKRISEGQKLLATRGDEREALVLFFG